MAVSSKLVTVIVVLIFLIISIPIIVKYKDRATSFLKTSNPNYCEETGVDQKQFTQNIKNLYSKNDGAKRAYQYYSYSAECFEIDDLDLESDVKKSIFCSHASSYLNDFPSEVTEKSKKYCENAK